MATPTALHPLQEEFSAAHALQCGFCTPGLLMTIEPMLEELANMTAAEIAEALSGNLCRCTGYQGVIDAVLAAVARDSSTV
ncbi:MAG: 2Fe-2S iron-sulfur cluster-binding protein [Ilumatobacter sp.]|nr:2Fe-2S iron-sulfur cluster-binding protein [Ilumatobacter sp.]